MSTQSTIISSYDATRRSREAQDQRSSSADGGGDNLMKGRTFIPRMSAESRKLLIEAMQKARKNRQERLGRKREDKEIGSALPSDITESQKTSADLGVEEFTTDAKLRGTFGRPSGTTGTGIANNVAAEPNTQYNNGQVKADVTLAESSTTPVNNNSQDLEGSKPEPPALSPVNTEQGETSKVKTGNAFSNFFKKRLRNRVKSSSTESTQTTNENNTVTNGVTLAPSYTETPQAANGNSTVANGAISESSSTQPTTTQQEPGSTDSAGNLPEINEEELATYTSIIDSGLDPIKEQNIYIPVDERTYQRQEGDREFVELYSQEKRNPAISKKVAETILAAIKGSIKGELPKSEEELVNLRSAIERPRLRPKGKVQVSIDDLTYEARYINAMMALGIKDYPEFSKLYRQVNNEEPPHETIDAEYLERDTYDIVNIRGRKLGINSNDVTPPKVIVLNNLPTSFSWLIDKDNRTDPQSLADELKSGKDGVDKGLVERLYKYSAVMLSRENLSPDDKDFIEYINRATKMALSNFEGGGKAPIVNFKDGGKIPNEPLPPTRVESTATKAIKNVLRKRSNRPDKEKYRQDFRFSSKNTDLSTGITTELLTRSLQKKNNKRGSERLTQRFTERDAFGKVINKDKQKKTIKYRR